MKDDVFYINNGRTISLEYYLRSCNTFDEFEKRVNEELLNDSIRVGEYLRDLLNKYDKKASVVSIDAGLNHSYVGNIINGKKNNPSRNVLICICFALGATLDETQYLLKYAGHAPLYVRRKRDVIIWFGLLKQESLDTVNTNLIDRGLTPLYKE